MAAKRATHAVEIYELEITLLASKPRIWRRFEAKNNCSLKSLHDVIQVVIGWEDCHLHEFHIGDWVYASLDPEFDDLDDREIRDEQRTRLDHVLGGEGFRFRYRYDLGDDWMHELEVVNVSQPTKGASYPICLAGERACPPEDVGGVWGYANMLDAIANSKHGEHEQYVEWLGDTFDPEAFDPKVVNRMLRRIR